MSDTERAKGLEMRRFTRDEYHRMAGVGILAEGEKVELIDGEILKKVPQGRPHASGMRRAHAVLQRAFGSDRYVQSQLPIAPDAYSEPEPDLAVLPGPFEAFEGVHPETALLVVEVSDTTLPFDLGRKANLYARSGIPEYWVLNIVFGRL